MRNCAWGWSAQAFGGLVDESVDVAASVCRLTSGFVAVQNKVATKGRGIMAMDESNATCGLRLASIGLDNTEANRQAYRQLLVSTPGLGEYISGAILFEETLYQNTTDGKKMIDVLADNGIIPGIKVDKVLYFSPHSPAS